MNYNEFLKRLRVKAEKEKDIRVWHVIHSYVCKCGQTDRYDRELAKALEAGLGKWISEAELKRQLRAMEQFGLLQGHRMTVKYTDMGRAMLPLVYSLTTLDRQQERLCDTRSPA